ncbi:MAG: hypothetical protein ABSF91_05415 [Bacteroidota bacterium]
MARVRSLLLIGVACVTIAHSQSGSQYQRSAVMNGNQVRTVFGNWGVIGQPIDTRPRGAWKNDNDGYLGDVSPFVGAEVRYRWPDTAGHAASDTSFHSVVTCPVSRPTGLPDQSADGVPWTFQPVAGYFAPSPNQSVAMSNSKSTWPSTWPDKDATWNGIWNGYFGKRKSADLETYFVMDDNNDERFNYSSHNPGEIAFKPDSTNPSRNGLALQVKVRALQWAQFLAQDNIFWLYEISNQGTTTYDRVVFGMLVGTYVGVTGSADNGEWDDDWSFYDAQTNLTYTGDFDQDNTRNPRWVGNADGLVGYAFLESPGNPFDGIDNDGDADSSALGRLAPQFSASDFDSVLITAGMKLVSIRNDFSRILFTVPSADSFKAWTRGMRDSIWLYPGKTKLVEGNVVLDYAGNQSINRNAYDGIDNNFNGLIDENQFVHYRQYKVNHNPPHQVLFDVYRPVRHVDYKNNVGTSPYSMIDEKRDDLIDNNQNWDIKNDDVGIDGIGPTAVDYPGPDCGEGDGKPTSGYDPHCNPSNLDLPGEPHIDKTDVNESDQIGLTSFYYFTPAGKIRLGDKEELWNDLAPGYFDVPPSINYVAEAGKSYPTSGEDGDFIYGSGYFPLLAHSSERFSIALVYGGGKNGKGTPWDVEIADLLKNKKTVQKIYDANYQFPQPPSPPTLTAVPGDHQVTLYWDRVAESSVDPVLRIKTFEGYKVYRSTDPDFSDIFTITDASGTPRGYQPLAQFDLKDGITGYFRATGDIYQDAAGYSFYLGDDGGLAHTYVDRSVDNGRRYFYAVVAYSFGDENLGIFPAENTKSIRLASSGEIDSKDINVAVVTPNGQVAGYVRPIADTTHFNHTAGPATGSISNTIVDERQLTDHRYRIEFLDTQVDSVDNNRNGLVDAADSSEWSRITSFYSVRDLNQIAGTFLGEDTISVPLPRQNLIPSTVTVKDQGGNVVAANRYILDAVRGSIRGSSPGSLAAGEYGITFSYYPVFKSPHLQKTPFQVENSEADNFDGIQLVFDNDWNVKVDAQSSGWQGSYSNPYLYGFSAADLPLLSTPIAGYAKPADYEIRFSSSIVDTSSLWPPSAPDYPFDTPIPVNFRIYNLTDSSNVKFLYFDRNDRGKGKISPFDQLVFLDKNPRGGYTPSWSILFSNKEGEPIDTLYNLSDGDKLVLKTFKPFRYGDIFEFKTELPRVDNHVAQSVLQRIRVVPNPYVTAASFEPPLNPGITSGRGTRKIDFIHLPASSKISIFTARGDHVVTLYQDGNIEDGTVSWNLKTEENLDVAFGVYFYVVESPVGNRTGKIAIIK